MAVLQNWRTIGSAEFGQPFLIVTAILGRELPDASDPSIKRCVQSLIHAEAMMDERNCDNPLDGLDAAV